MTQKTFGSAVGQICNVCGEGSVEKYHWQKRHQSSKRQLKGVLENLYVENEKSTPALAGLFNVDKATVWRWLKGYDIKIRSHKESVTIIQKERIAKYPIEFTSLQKSILFGSLLGDESLSFENSIFPSFSVCHTGKHKDYLDFKYRVLSNFCDYPIKYRKKQDAFRFYSAHLPIFRELYNLFYFDGEKRVTEEILNKLDRSAISIWFLDDGTLMGHRCYRLCTFINYSENLLIKDYFKKNWGIESNVCQMYDGKFVLNFRTTANLWIAETIMLHATPNSQYVF